MDMRGATTGITMQGATSGVVMQGFIDTSELNRFTVVITGSIDPVFTAAALADGDFVWHHPDGVTTFTGKAPASANFDATGEYVLRCTDWTKVTGIDLAGDAISGDCKDIRSEYVTGNLYLQSTSISGDVADLACGNVTDNLYLFSTSISGDVADLDCGNVTDNLYL